MADTFDVSSWAERNPGAVAALMKSYPRAWNEMHAYCKAEPKYSVRLTREKDAKAGAKEIDVEMKPARARVDREACAQRFG